MNRLFRICSLLLALLMLLSPGTVYASDLDYSELEAIESIPDEEIIRAMVLLEGNGAAEGTDCSPGDTLFAAREEQLERTHQEILQDMEDAVPEVQVVHEFTTLFSGMSVDIPYGQLETISAIDGVMEVWPVTTYEVPALTEELYSDATGSPFSAAIESSSRGEGTLIAILDTGVNLSHEAFGVYGDILGQTVLTSASGSAASVSGAYVSDKIPFAYDYADKDANVMDTNGHGSHVAGIAAGYAESGDGGIRFSGAAPAAQLAIMKIFSDGSGTTTTDVYFAALQDAYLLGADVVSMSLGTACGFTYDNNLDSLLFGNVYSTLENAGIIVCCAGGNDGSQADDNTYSSGTVLADYADYGKVASPSTYLGNTSVANATSATKYSYVLETDGTCYAYTEPLGQEGRFVRTFGDTSLTFTTVGGYGTTEDFSATDVTGKIALVSRGEISFDEKIANAAAAGAAGVVIYNNDTTDVLMQANAPAIPAAFVSAADGAALMAASEPVMYFHAAQQALSGTVSQTLYRDSSWGTTPDLTLAPTLTAVGTRVSSVSLSGTDTYRTSTGTSMSTPRVAGQFALLLSHLKATAPQLTKPQRAALAESMACSSAEVLGSDSTILSVRRQGAGLMDPAKAISAAAYIDNPLQELGDDPNQTGVYKMTLLLKNNRLTGMTCAADRFLDVSTGDWFHEEVDYMTHIGVFKGTGPDEFSPSRQLTRAEAITALYRMAGSPAVTEASTFNDVDANSYYADAVAWAQTQGITTGTGDNQFSPNMALSREQLVTLLYRYLDCPADREDLSSYVDGDQTADYALEAWQWAVATGAITSCSTEYLILSPNGIATRAELATVLYRLLNQALTVTYTPSVQIYSDSATQRSDGLIINNLTSTPLDCTVSYTCDSPITFDLSTEEIPVTVTIALTESAKDTLKSSFQYGTYVEGTVNFSCGEETIHATFLSYFGDWDDAPVLEQTDFRDVALAEDYIRNEELAGFTYYDLLPMNLEANKVQLYCNDESSSYYKYALTKLGDNAFSTVVDYNPDHAALTTAETDADFVYAQQLLVRTYSLRNAESLTYTVRDADTGTVYGEFTHYFCGKSVYKSAWKNSSSLYWSAADANGNPLPAGTRVTVTVSASVRGNETHDQLSFTLTIDPQAPTADYHIRDNILTVTAKDNEYLAALEITDADDNTLTEDAYSDSEKAQSHTLTVDLSQVTGNVIIKATDYATNQRIITVAP